MKKIGKPVNFDHSGEIVTNPELNGVFDSMQAIQQTQTDSFSHKTDPEEQAGLDRLYKTVLESSRDIISTMTLDLKFTYVSPRVTDALGFTPMEMLGLDALDFVTPECRSLMKLDLDEWLQNSGSVTDPTQNSLVVELQSISKSGKKMWTEMTGSLLRDHWGSPLGIVAIWRDITKRKILEQELRNAYESLEAKVGERTSELECINEKLFLEIHRRQQAQQQLTESENRCRAIFQAAQDCIFMKDKELRYTHINPAMLELTAKAPHEILGRRFDDVYGKDGGFSIQNADLRALQGQTVESDYTLIMEGRKIVLNCIRVPIRNDHGQVTGVCGIARDITERMARTIKKISPPVRYSSRIYKSTLKEIELVAGTESNVLFLGESGTGKDYLAKYLHEKSRRSGGPFFAVNCAALPSTLAESELFGHESGAFTGSRTRKRGLLELAESGTLLLNEVGELAPALQAKLLTFLDTHAFTRVGGEKFVEVDARILAATNRDLGHEVEFGNFRRDLFFRLNVFAVVVPPLRERISDLPMLCDDIIEGLVRKLGLGKTPAVDVGAMKILKAYSWPGNVRELKNVLERALILSGTDKIRERDLTELMLPKRSEDSVFGKIGISGSSGPAITDAVRDLQKSLIQESLFNNNGCVTRAASSLGMTRDALKYLMKKLDLSRKNAV